MNISSVSSHVEIKKRRGRRRADRSDEVCLTKLLFPESIGYLTSVSHIPVSVCRSSRILDFLFVSRCPKSVDEFLLEQSRSILLQFTWLLASPSSSSLSWQTGRKPCNQLACAPDKPHPPPYHCRSNLELNKGGDGGELRHSIWRRTTDDTSIVSFSLSSRHVNEDEQLN